MCGAQVSARVRSSSGSSSPIPKLARASHATIVHGDIAKATLKPGGQVDQQPCDQRSIDSLILR